MPTVPALSVSSLAALVERDAPHEAAIEETFVNRDPQSALKLGQARGGALVNLTPGPTARASAVWLLGRRWRALVRRC